LVHFTDVHFYAPPSPRQALGKRALGLINLHVVGRAKYFDATDVVGRLVSDALTFEPDLAAITGDLSAMSSDEEFRRARAGFAPLLEAIPTTVIPGNHDRYTRGAVRSARMEQHFGAWMGGGTWNGDAWADPDVPAGDAVVRPVVFRIGDVSIVATDPCRATLRSSGRFPPGVLAAAERRIGEERAAGRVVVFLLHYPPLARTGSPYRRPGHCLIDVDAVVDMLRRAAPDLVLHGHKHECWRTHLDGAGGRRVVILNCGSSSAVSPIEDRAAGYFLIELDERGVTAVRRRILLGGADAPCDHPGTFEGAHATVQPLGGGR
jgi:3',5'-cyclic AMP phosphodiesterase CpdA